MNVSYCIICQWVINVVVFRGNFIFHLLIQTTFNLQITVSSTALVVCTIILTTIQNQNQQNDQIMFGMQIFIFVPFDTPSSYLRLHIYHSSSINLRSMPLNWHFLKSDCSTSEEYTRFRSICGARPLFQVMPKRPKARIWFEEE